MTWNMPILVSGTSLPLRAHSHARICTLVSYGDAPLSPRVWAHHSPSPKRNLRKGWFFENVIFFFTFAEPVELSRIQLPDSILLNSTQFYSILLNSTRFYSISWKINAAPRSPLRRPMPARAMVPWTPPTYIMWGYE